MSDVRCGRCGEAMLPRSERDNYECYRRKVTHGMAACATAPIKRAEVDAAPLKMFESWSLDLDATRAALTEQVSERVQVAVVEADRAAAEIQERRAGLERIERDYLAGDLPAGDYARLSAKLAEELAAAEGEYERFSNQADAMREGGQNLDDEHETLIRLTELRQAIAAHVGNARDIGALRAAIGSVFETVYLRPTEHPITSVEGYAESAEQVGAYWVEPRLREEMIVSREDAGAGMAILKPVALKLAPDFSPGRGVPE